MSVDPNPYAQPRSSLGPTTQGPSSVVPLDVAPAWKRLAAFVIDFYISIAPMWLFQRMFLGPRLREILSRPTVQSHLLLFILTFSVLALGVCLFPLMYFSFGDSSHSGATLGKRFLKIRVTRPDGTRVSFPRAVVRNLLKFLTNTAYGIGSLFAFFSPLRRTLHDRMVDTLVIRGRVEVDYLVRDDFEETEKPHKELLESP